MNNFENIKAGDEVAIIFRNDIKLVKVDRITKTQIIIRDNKYRKKDGDGIGPCGSYGMWSTKSYISPITPEIEERLKIKELNNKKKYYIEKILGFDLYQLSLDKLKNIVDMIITETEEF